MAESSETDPQLGSPALASPPVHALVRERWSPRAFADRPVGAEALAALFEAARWAPSCFNEQPWSFLVATRDEPEGYDLLLGCLVEANSLWASRAPVLGLSVARETFRRNGRPNAHAWHDVGQAMAQLALQAAARGLVVHQMGGFDRDAARQRCGIPDGQAPVAAFALGHPGAAEQLPESLRERELAARERRPRSSFVFTARWGEPRS